MRTSEFNFDLPSDLIALHPVEPRDAARLLVVDPGTVGGDQFRSSHDVFQDRSVRDLPDLLAPGDVLVVNNTRVIPAALEGERRRSDATVRVRTNLVRRLGEDRWQAYLRPARRIAVGDEIEFGQAHQDGSTITLRASVAAKDDGGLVELVFDAAGPALDSAVARIGAMPLPPYIASRRQITDTDRLSYQTVFAETDGAVAAPTAALHFTQELLDSLAAREVDRVAVTLHVGAGTFLPVKSASIADHQMHAEWGEITPSAAARLNSARSRGGRIVAVGTTAVRLLETAVDDSGYIHPFAGETDLLITPGHSFRAVDVLMTNFHLPQSTLFMLVCAFSGFEVMKAAYAHAIANRYRFYSYGDASLLFPASSTRRLPA